MPTTLNSVIEDYQAFKLEAQSRDPELTDWEEGSINDLIAGSVSYGMNEVKRHITDEFKKTFFKTADGPEVTEGPDYLEDLAIDHFGDEFARPDAQKASGVVLFSRPTTGAGDVTIPAGTIVRSETNANGEAQRFETILDVEMTALEVSASVRALSAGTKGNVEEETVTVVETALTDTSITVINNDAFVGGAAKEDDAAYRTTIIRLIRKLGKATLESIRATCLEVPGVEQCSVIEKMVPVIEYDIALDDTVGEFFRIARAYIYIADANGTASTALLNLVRAAILSNRACGVHIVVLAAAPITLDWTANITLNPGGPNFTDLSDDPSMIEDSMAEYVNSLNTGDDFVRTVAKAAIMAIWGPAGTNDLTNFVTSVPSGDVSIAENQKLLADTMSVV